MSLLRYDLKLVDFAKSVARAQEIPFQRTNFQKFSGGTYPRTPLDRSRLRRECLTNLQKILNPPLDSVRLVMIA